MNPKSHPSHSVGIFVPFLIFGTVLVVSCGEWVMPNSLVGTWVAQQVVSVRYESGFMSFRFAKDSVNIAVTIHENGSVTGTVGGAKFEDCSVASNRGWFGRTFNLGTDYAVAGRLSGSIFGQDTLLAKEINILFSVKDGIVEGAIFQKQGVGVFPMVNIYLTKQ